MKISEAIAGLAATLRDKGDLDVWFCVKDSKSETFRLNSLPLISGGWVMNIENLPIAFLSPENINLEGVVNESIPSNQ